MDAIFGHGLFAITMQAYNHYASDNKQPGPVGDKRTGVREGLRCVLFWAVLNLKNFLKRKPIKINAFSIFLLVVSTNLSQTRVHGYYSFLL